MSGNLLSAIVLAAGVISAWVLGWAVGEFLRVHRLPLHPEWSNDAL